MDKMIGFGYMGIGLLSLLPSVWVIDQDRAISLIGTNYYVSGVSVSKLAVHERIAVAAKENEYIISITVIRISEGFLKVQVAYRKKPLRAIGLHQLSFSVYSMRRHHLGGLESRRTFRWRHCTF